MRGLLVRAPPRAPLLSDRWLLGFRHFGVRVSRFLSEHRLGSFAVTTVALLQIGQTR